jgi:hypothetical protein
MMDWLASVPSLLLQLAGGVAIVLGLLVPPMAVFWWLNRRDRRRWEVHAQLREMEQAIWEESLPDWQREAIQKQRQQQVEIHREARRRLGLPDEEP